MTCPSRPLLFPGFLASPADFASCFGGGGPPPQIGRETLFHEMEEPLIDRRAENFLGQGDFLLFPAFLGIKRRLNQAVVCDGFSDSGFPPDSAFWG